MDPPIYGDYSHPTRRDIPNQNPIPQDRDVIDNQ